MSRNDAIVQCSINSKELATVALYMHENGIHPKTRSELLRVSIETLADIVVNKGGAQRIERTTEATEILHKLFGAELNPSGRLKAAMLKNLQEEYEDGESVPIRDNKPHFESINSGRKELTNVYKEAANRYLGIKPEPKFTPEEMEEFKRQSLAINEASIEVPLTPLQIERNKAILIATEAKIAPHREAIAQLKTEKPKEHHQIAISKLIKLAERAKDDDEALRILIDEAE